MPKSTRQHRQKPPKPRADFPLFAHANGRWAKKIRGKMAYFGKWEDPDAALAEYLDKRDDLYAGRRPRPKAEGLELRDLLNRFLDAKTRKLEAGEIKPKTFGDLHATCARLADAFGGRRLVDDLRADDFGRLRAAIAKRRGPVALGNEVQRVRSVFKYGYEAGLVEQPIRFGPEFVKPAAKAMRQARAANGHRMLEPDQCRALLDEATVPMRAAIFLGLNAGYGNTDIGELPFSALDLDAAIIDFPRPKTAIARRCTLWPETEAALKAAIGDRPKPKSTEHARLVFITRWGRPWVQGKTDSVGLEFAKLLRKLSIPAHGRFYVLRHVFRTVADATRDVPAIDLIMGHNDPSMGGRYRERIDDMRLQAVTEHVRAWLFGG